MIVRSLRKWEENISTFEGKDTVRSRRYKKYKTESTESFPISNKNILNRQSTLSTWDTN